MLQCRAGVEQLGVTLPTRLVHLWIRVFLKLGDATLDGVYKAVSVGGRMSTVGRWNIGHRGQYLTGGRPFRFLVRHFWRRSRANTAEVDGLHHMIFLHCYLRRTLNGPAIVSRVCIEEFGCRSRFLLPFYFRSKLDSVVSLVERLSGSLIDITPVEQRGESSGRLLSRNKRRISDATAPRLSPRESSRVPC